MRLTYCQQWQQRLFFYNEIELWVIPGWCAPQGHPELSVRFSSLTISNPHSTWFRFWVNCMNAAGYCLKWLIPELQVIMWVLWMIVVGVSLMPLPCKYGDVTRLLWLRFTTTTVFKRSLQSHFKSHPKYCQNKTKTNVFNPISTTLLYLHYTSACVCVC